MLINKETGEVAKFRSRTSYPKPEPQPAFSEFKPLYEIKLNDKGQKELKQNGQENLYKQIQEFKDECDVYAIIQRAALGDTSILEKRTGEYMDTTGFPKTIQEQFQFVQKAMSDFDKLPAEIKADFNNSVYEFAGADKEKLEKAIRKVKRQPEPEKHEKPEKPIKGQIEIDEIQKAIKEAKGE